MPVSNPLTGIDRLATGMLASFPPIAEDAGVEPQNIHVWDRVIDFRDEPQQDLDSGKRIWLVPIGTSIDMEATSGSARITQRYHVGYATADRTIESARKCEWALIRLAARLYRSIDAGGAPLDVSELEPMVLDSITTGAIEPDQEPIDAPEEWQGVFALNIIAMVAHEDLVA